jgi:hypothetical protein
MDSWQVLACPFETWPNLGIASGVGHEQSYAGDRFPATASRDIAIVRINFHYLLHNYASVYMT